MKSRVRYLSPDDIRAFKSDGMYRLTLLSEQTYLAFSAVLTHPFSLPESYISLLDGTNEIGIIRELRELDQETQGVVRAMLADRYFIPRITRIISRRELYSGLVWQVETDRGYRTVTTKSLYESIWQASDIRYFMVDTDGNRYEIRIDQLPKEDAAWIRKTV